VNQGEVYWCELPEPDRRRPAVILTRQSSIGHLSALTIAPVTTRLRVGPSFVPLSIEDGLFADCCVNCDAIQTIPKSAIRQHIAQLSADKLRAIQKAVRFTLGLDAMR
jgi:mRNA interferase MazF